MFLVIFGLIWTLVSGFVLTIMLSTGDGPIGAILFMLLFVGVGLFCMIKGILEVLRNYMTNKKGIVCYGIIEKLEPTNTSYNGNPVYRANAMIYLESENRVISCSESLGLDIRNIVEGSCVKVKYYNNDINYIDMNVDFNTIPYNAQNALSSYYIDRTKINNTTSVDSRVIYENDNIIEVNGVKYKKM